MNNAGLEIVVSADVSNATTNVNKLNSSLGNLPKGANQATFALTNLSRVAQDAPYGFIGIANNINPLLESFQRLQAETGSTKNALLAMASGLTGPAGLGLAVGVVSSLLVVFSNSINKSRSEIKESTKDTDGYIRKLSEQKIKVEGLVKLAQDESQAQQSRALAIQKLNDIIPDTIGKLNLHNIKTAEGINIIRKYTQAIEAQATAELLMGRIAANNIKLFDNRNKALKGYADFEKQISDLRLKAESLRQKGQFEQADLITQNILQMQKQSEVSQANLRKETEGILNDNKLLRDQYNKLIPEEIKLTDLKLKGSEAVSKTTEYKKDELSMQAEINGALERYYQTQIKIKETNAQMLNDVLKNLPKRQPGSQLGTQYSTLNQLSIFGDDSMKVASANIETVNKKLLDTQDIVMNGINGGIDQFFNAIANNQDPFKALAQSAMRLVTELGAAVVKALILRAITAAIDPSGNVGSLANKGLSGLTGGFKGAVRGQDIALTLGRLMG